MLQKDEVLAILPTSTTAALAAAPARCHGPVRISSAGSRTSSEVSSRRSSRCTRIRREPWTATSSTPSRTRARTTTLGKGVVEDLFGADAAVERAWAYLLGSTSSTSGEPTNGRSTRRSASRSPTCEHTGSETCGTSSGCASSTSTRCGRARIAADQSVVIGVNDPWFADNVGTWRAEASGAKRRRRTGSRGCDRRAVGAHLGGTSWAELADWSCRRHRRRRSTRPTRLRRTPRRSAARSTQGERRTIADRLRSVLGGVAGRSSGAAAPTECKSA